MVARSFFVASALMAIATAQTIVTSSAASVAASTTIAQVMPPAATAGFNAANVSSSEAFAWCHAQLNTCPQICGGAASVNTCDDTSFTYSCTCPNGTVPDCTAFTNTLPYFICQATFGQCIDDHPMDAQGQAMCATNEVCGTRNATAEAIAQTSAAAAASAASTSSAAASSSASAASTGSASGSAASSAASASSTKNAAEANTQHLATGAFAAVLLAAMKLVL